uniref:Uncharacterized protein n=1 Tax=Rhizophora mucronata TaxID=61149 RepID=A0A2P2QD46_RHIMU
MSGRHASIRPCSCTVAILHAMSSFSLHHFTKG